MSIQVLPPQVANQIAAGEVVERPSAVVKELMENCLDAGATRILVEIVNGGAKKILIRDNGCGIPQNELALALKRHATSKLSSIQDLNRLTSMGFRGEALASIAAVSRLTLTSKPASQNMAYAVEVEGIAQEPKISPASHPDGTTIEALDLFFNTPARRRFLKSEKTEFLQVEEVFKRIAISRPDVAFVLKNNGKVVYDLKAVGFQNEIRRLEALLGKGIASELNFFEWSDTSLSIRGYVSVRAKSKPVQYFFVNGRIVRDKVVIHAVREAYESVFAEKGDVSYVCFLQMPPEDVDINVHPQKSEVRFQESRRVHDFIQTSVMNVFRNAQMVLPETMNDTANSQQSHHYGGVKPLAFDEKSVSDFWALNSMKSNTQGAVIGENGSQIKKMDLNELLDACTDTPPEVFKRTETEKNQVENSSESPDRDIPEMPSSVKDTQDHVESFRKDVSGRKDNSCNGNSAGGASLNYNRMFNLGRGKSGFGERASSGYSGSGRARWSGDAMSKMFGTAAVETTEMLSEGSGVNNRDETLTACTDTAPVSIKSGGFQNESFQEADVNWHEPWYKDEVSEFSLYRVVTVTDDAEYAVISNGSQIRLIDIKKLAQALFTDSFMDNRRQLLQTVNLLVPFDFREKTFSPYVDGILHDLGFVTRVSKSAFTVLAVPYIVHGLNLADILASLLERLDDTTGVRDAMDILAEVLFNARIPENLSSKMIARLVQSITYEKYFEEKLSSAFENIDLSVYIENLRKK